ncbi:YitT family protein [Clostridium tarantellae]|uniref:YitT family protein n=1 Tax=Clostridium tarantellae TaxID=39493 RepID=A0A6I1MNT8_9CLOT|nr:YitT family protein [Clostridium tarantellae]MPQ44138.1 YitT family protein [Clostridium tarantellae]
MREKKLKLIKEYAFITMGVIIIAFGLQSFYLSNNIAAGGLTGLALVINNYIPSFSVSAINFIGNGILLIGAFAIIDRDFGFKTIYASMILSISIDIIGNFLNGNALTNNLLLSVIGGASVMSCGLFLLISNNASTGGTEILAKILNKYSKINIAIALLCADLLVIICGALTFGIAKGILAFLAVTLTGTILNNIIKFNNKFKQEKYTCENIEINETIEDIGSYAGVN